MHEQRQRDLGLSHTEKEDWGSACMGRGRGVRWDETHLIEQLAELPALLLTSGPARGDRGGGVLGGLRSLHVFFWR